MPERDDDNFLLRWSRRKRGEEDDPDANRPPRPDAADGDPAPAPAEPDGPREADIKATAGGDVSSTESEGEANEAVPPELEDVDIEALDYDSDYTRFMKDGVPEALKRRALRQLWRSDPILANVDGLNDYDGDFTDAALVVDVLKTVHKVGRGYLEDDDDDVDDLDLDDSEDIGDEGRPDAVADSRGAEEEVAARSEEPDGEADPIEPSVDGESVKQPPKTTT